MLRNSCILYIDTFIFVQLNFKFVIHITIVYKQSHEYTHKQTKNYIYMFLYKSI